MIFLIILNSCVEPYEIATQTFENSLVIEATITNELKFQEIKLGRTFRLEDEEPLVESNATVSVVDDVQNSYTFQEIDTGKYQSTTKFSALPDRNYQLLITTHDGRKYTSTPTQLTNISSSFKLSFSKDTNLKGFEGVRIVASSFDPNGKSKYYRYTFDETYKIIVPYWSPLDGFGVSTLPSIPDPPPYHEVYTLPRTKEEEVCYKTIKSEEILQTDTNLFTEDRVSKYPIQFIAKNEFKITHRYSILVRQYVQSLEAYTFYKTLDKFSGFESLFSQNQQGFVIGNVFSINEPNEHVLGYFEVSSALTQRIFFNFEDIFPNDEKPPYLVHCDLLTPDLDDRSAFGNPKFSPLIQLLSFQGLKFVDFNNPIENPNNPFVIVRKECSDCTSLGSNIKPDFWID